MFGAALVLMYTASTLFHSIPLPRTKQVLRVVDHCLIYVLIAGTYDALRPHHPARQLGLVAVGLHLDTRLTSASASRSSPSPGVSRCCRWRSTWEWAACGIIVTGVRCCNGLAVPGLWLLLVGGLCYTVGVAFYSWRQLRYHHAIWHLFVLAAAASGHYFAGFALRPAGALNRLTRRQHVHLHAALLAAGERQQTSAPPPLPGSRAPCVADLTS